jgi:hypothetical protein
MIDLKQLEEQTWRVTGMSVEQILSSLENPLAPSLCSGYVQIRDRHTALLQSIHRSTEETVELDRIESLFGMLLGETGWLAVGGICLRVFSSGICALSLFTKERPSTLESVQAKIAIESAAGALSALPKKTPTPVVPSRLLELCERAVRTLSFLSRFHLNTPATKRIFCSGSIAAICLRDLVDAVSAQPDSLAVLRSLRGLLEPVVHSPRKILRRTELCYRLAGMVGCLELIQEAAAPLKQLPGWFSDDLLALASYGKRARRR